MPQWRKLHTKITESLDVAEMPDDFTRLLWVLLPTQLCREGRGVDNPSWVRARVFPLREDVTLAMISDAMDWYETREMIVRYEADGRRYFCVPTFHRYQGNTTKEAESAYPPPPDLHGCYARPTPDLLQSNSASDSDSDSDSDADSDAEERLGGAGAPQPDPSPVRPHVQDPEPETKRRSGADPRTRHAAIQCARGVTGKLPPKALYDQIISTLSEHPDGPRAAACYQEWLKRGYNSNAWTWLLEWYPNGIPKQGGSGRPRAPADNEVSLEEFQAQAAKEARAP